MDEIVGALREQQAELGTIVSGLDDDALLCPSRCDGWTVADVLLHLAQTNEMAVASVHGRLTEFVDDAAAGLDAVGSVDEWAGALVAKERAEPRVSLDRWVLSAEAQVAAFAACDPAERLTWVAGQLAARSLATTRLTETWIHTVDVAVAFGEPPAPTDRLWHVARLAWRTVPYALAQAGIDPAGPVAFDLEAPDGSGWAFRGGEEAATVVTGTALDLCTVAGQRADARDTGLTATGPDADAVLRLVRTFA